MKASLLYQSNNILAEGPFWHAERKSFLWVDIEGKSLHEYDWKSGQVKSLSLPYRVSTIVQDRQGSLILGMQGGLASIDLDTGSLTWLVDIEKERSGMRTNDGKCGPNGKLWIGTMHIHEKEGEGSFYYVDESFSVNKKIENLTIPNGLAWSLDHRRMYHIDSPAHSVRSYWVDNNTGDLSFEKTAITIPPAMGTPDGMTIDEEGMLWVAHWGGFGVYRWNPENGKLLDKIEVPVPQVTSCVFGGELLDHLLITTAGKDLSEEEIKSYPLSGSIFIAKPGVKGIPAHKFGK